MKCSEIILIKQGNPDIYRRLVKEWFPKLSILINSYIFNVEVARDLAQDILISLWENKDKLRDDTTFDKYFYVLAKNKAFNYLKQKRYDIIDIEDYESDGAIIREGFSGKYYHKRKHTKNPGTYSVFTFK